MRAIYLSVENVIREPTGRMPAGSTCHGGHPWKTRGFSGVPAAASGGGSLCPQPARIATWNGRGGDALTARRDALVIPGHRW